MTISLYVFLMRSVQVREIWNVWNMRAWFASALPRKGLVGRVGQVGRVRVLHAPHQPHLPHLPYLDAMCGHPPTTWAVAFAVMVSANVLGAALLLRSRA